MSQLFAAFVLATCLAVPGFARAANQCYLEDAAATCPLCWTTNSAGVTKMAQCPEGIKLAFGIEPPSKMFEGEAYNITYSLLLSPEMLEDLRMIEKDANNAGGGSESWALPHANIHSCVASRGACTPFVSNTPGLSTHSPALKGNLDTNGVASFESSLQLPAEKYTVIAHVRFYLVDKSIENPIQACEGGRCLVTYDVAVGTFRDVMPMPPEIPADAWIWTGIVAAVLAILAICGIWAAWTGKLDLANILEAMSREDVTIIIDLVVGTGDNLAFTTGLATAIMPDPKLQTIIPIAWLVCAVGWIAGILNAYFALLQLYVIYNQNSDHNSYMRIQAKRITREILRDIAREQIQMQQSLMRSLTLKPSEVNSRQDPAGLLRASSRKGSQAEAEKLDLEESFCMAFQSEEESKKLLFKYDLACRELQRLYGDLLTVLVVLPSTAISAYVLVTTDAVEIVSVLAFLTATLVLGAKMSGLGSFKSQLSSYKTSKKVLMDYINRHDKLKESRSIIVKRRSSIDMPGLLTEFSSACQWSSSESFSPGTDLQAPELHGQGSRIKTDNNDKQHAGSRCIGVSTSVPTLPGAAWLQ